MSTPEEPALFGGGGDGQSWGVVLHGRLTSVRVPTPEALDALVARLRALGAQHGVSLALVIGTDDLVEMWDPVLGANAVVCVLGVPLLLARGQGLDDFHDGLDALNELDESDPSYEARLALLGGDTVDLRSRSTVIPAGVWSTLADVLVGCDPDEQCFFWVGGWNRATIDTDGGPIVVSTEDGVPVAVSVPLDRLGAITVEDYI